MKLSLDARPFALLAALAIPACGGADPRDDAPAPASAGEDILIRLPPTIYACGTRITKGGTWHVFSDLTASGTTPCVSLNDVSGVTIDCHGHTITTGTQAGARAFEITNAGGTTIQNCRVKAAPGYADAVADFAFTYGALLQGDTFASDPTSGAQVNVHVADSTNFTAENSTFTMQLSQERSVGSTIASN